MLNEILEDANNVAVPTDDSVRKIARLAETQARIERQIAQAETDLSDLKEHLKEVQERLLPDAMLEAGVNSFELASGEKITVKPFYGASITDANRGDCFKWLEGHGHAAIIKKEFNITIPRGDLPLEAKLKMDLEDHGVDYKTKEAIHPGTLQAFVREMVESGADFPMDLFKVFTGRKAKIQGVK